MRRGGGPADRKMVCSARRYWEIFEARCRFSILWDVGTAMKFRPFDGYNLRVAVKINVVGLEKAPATSGKRHELFWNIVRKVQAKEDRKA